MDFIKKGMISTKYLADGCEFKKVNNNYKLVSTSNNKYEPFLGKILSEPAWDLILSADITSGTKYNELYSLLLDHFKSGNTIFKKDVNLLLKKDEFVVYQSSNNIALKEPKSIRVTNSAHVGSSHRRGKRSFGYGASKSVGETQEVVKVIDTGQITITNKRFIFSGTNRNIDVNITQIVGITPYIDGFKLQRKGKKKPEYFINIDSYVFTYNFNNENYFFIMNGQIIKSLIEGGLNKNPQKSKLQLLSSQKQITNKSEINTFSCDDFSLKYNSSWSKIQNKKNSDILTMEQITPPYRAEIRIAKVNIKQKSQNLEHEVKNVIKQKGFEILDFKKIVIDGVEILYFSSEKNIDNKPLEFDATIFYCDNIQYSIYLTNNKLNVKAKNDYDAIRNSLSFKHSHDNGNSDEKPNFCPNCGAHIVYDGNFCQNCGFKLN